MKRTVQITLQLDVHAMTAEDLEADGIDLAIEGIDRGDGDTLEVLAERVEWDDIGTALADYVTRDEDDPLVNAAPFLVLKNAHMLRAEWVLNAAKSQA